MSHWTEGLTHTAERQDIDYEGCRHLWVAAVWQGIREAVGLMSVSGSRQDNDLIQRQCAAWMGTPDFYDSCRLAGVNPHAIMDAWRAGRITKESVREVDGRWRSGARKDGD